MRYKEREREAIMKSASNGGAKSKAGTEIRSEYRFDYRKAKPNRFADRARKGSVAVLLDPDVARVFKDGASVNAVLRALLTTMPARKRAPSH